MKKLALLFVVLFFATPALSDSVDINDRPELGAATSADSIMAVNDGEAAGSRLSRILFTGDADDTLNGVGSFVAPQYGEIYYHSTGFDTVTLEQDVYQQILGFATNGESNGVTPDHTNDHLTIGESGMYFVNFSVSSRAQQADTFQLMVKLNNGTANCGNLMTHRTTTVAGKLAGGSVSGFCALTAADTVEVWIQRVTGGAQDKTITIEHTNLNVKKIGE